MHEHYPWLEALLILSAVAQAFCLIASGIMTTEEEEPLHTYIADSKLASGQKIFLLILIVPSTIAFLLLRAVIRTILWIWDSVLGAKPSSPRHLYKHKVRVVEVLRTTCFDLDDISTEVKYEVQYRGWLAWRRHSEYRDQKQAMQKASELTRRPVTVEKRRVIA